MSVFRLTLSQKNLKAETITQFMVALATKFPNAQLVAAKQEPSTSRDARLQEIATTVADAATDVEDLRQEIEDWKESLPENLQSGTKADELDEAAQALEEIKDALESVDFTSVSFPGMY